MASVKLAEKVAAGGRLVVAVTEISTEDSPETPRAVTPPIIASLQTLESPCFSEHDDETAVVGNRKRPSPSSPNEEVSPVPQRSRSILQPIDNSVRSPTLARRCSLGDTPSSFVGSPIKKKRRLSSIKRL